MKLSFKCENKILVLDKQPEHIGEFVSSSSIVKEVLEGAVQKGGELSQKDTHKFRNKCAAIERITTWVLLV